MEDKTWEKFYMLFNKCKKINKMESMLNTEKVMMEILGALMQEVIREDKTTEEIRGMEEV